MISYEQSYAVTYHTFNNELVIDGPCELRLLKDLDEVQPEVSQLVILTASSTFRPYRIVFSQYALTKCCVKTKHETVSLKLHCYYRFQFEVKLNVSSSNNPLLKWAQEFYSNLNLRRTARGGMSNFFQYRDKEIQFVSYYSLEKKKRSLSSFLLSLSSAKANG